MKSETYPDEHAFDALLAISSDMVMIIEDEIIKHVNAGDEDWLLYHELIGKPFYEFFQDDVLLTLRGHMDAAYRSREIVKNELVFRPEQLPTLKTLGLKEVIWFGSRMLVTEGDSLVWTLRNINDRKKLEKRISSQSQRDPLTGAYNRRALMPVFEQSFAQAQRYGGTYSALLIDVDKFSEVNDEYGWDAGDQLLRHLVTDLHQIKRTSDFLARYSDDQFMLALPETNHDQAMLAAERVRHLAEVIELPFAQGNIKFTVSIGVAALLGADDSTEDMLHRLQENLSIATHSGGNRVEGET